MEDEKFYLIDDSFINLNEERRRNSWVSDTIIEKCLVCDKYFTLFRRKHHCRNCGGIFCYECCSSYIKIPKFIDNCPKPEYNLLDIKNYIPTTIKNKTLSILGANLMTEVMDELIKQGELQSSPQNEVNVTYAEKVTKEESKINWHDSALVIARKIRAFNSFPVAQTEYREAVCKIWEAQVAIDTNEDANIGQIIKLDEFIHVKCGEGVLSIKELQMPGGKRLKAKEFILGHRPILGDVFKS